MMVKIANRPLKHDASSLDYDCVTPTVRQSLILPMMASSLSPMSWLHRQPGPPSARVAGQGCELPNCLEHLTTLFGTVS